MIDVNKIPECPYCHSVRIKKDGLKNGKQGYKCNDCQSNFRTEIVELSDSEKELLAQNVKLAKQRQKLMDTNRIERKSFRENARVENAIEEYNAQLVTLLKEQKLDYKVKATKVQGECCGIIHLSDTHLNELINIYGNQYDFTIAAKRLQKLAMKSKAYFKCFGIKNVLIAFTGDLLNNDNIYDKLLNQATNRAQATLLAFYLLKQFIADLMQSFKITIASVTGNEGRIDKERGYSDIMASNNYDVTLENFLKIEFEGAIQFIDGDYTEKVINIAGQNILMMHGDNMGRGETQREIQSKIGSYAAKGQIINYVIYGHLHSPNISSLSARSGSLSGSNDYNEKKLNLVGRASQNIYILGYNGDREAIMVDLQETSNIEGYDIIKELEAYNAKSSNKTKNKNTIFQVVI